MISSQRKTSHYIEHSNIGLLQTPILDGLIDNQGIMSSPGGVISLLENPRQFAKDGR